MVKGKYTLKSVVERKEIDHGKNSQKLRRNQRKYTEKDLITKGKETSSSLFKKMLISI